MVGPADVASRLNELYKAERALQDGREQPPDFTLYSDGVTEESNHLDEPFGDERLLHALDETRGLTLDESVESLVGSVLSWHGATHLSDDLSVLAVEVFR